MTPMAPNVGKPGKCLSHFGVTADFALQLSNKARAKRCIWKVRTPSCSRLLRVR